LLAANTYFEEHASTLEQQLKDMQEVVPSSGQESREAQDNAAGSGESNYIQVSGHNIKLSAKNGVIEKLLTKDREHNSSIETLRTELDIFKGLQQFTNVNMGMMARFKECAKLERELEEKDMVIQRLNSVIEEYRYENQ